MYVTLVQTVPLFSIGVGQTIELSFSDFRKIFNFGDHVVPKKEQRYKWRNFVFVCGQIPQFSECRLIRIE